jgi:hypothetical protein
MLLLLDDRGALQVSEASPAVCVVTRSNVEVTAIEALTDPLSIFFAPHEGASQSADMHRMLES